MKRIGHVIKLAAGFLVSGIFLYFAFRQINFNEMGKTFRETKYILFVPSLLIIFLSHWLRSWRWQYLVSPLKKVSVVNLFSALMIGYLGNSILPAHLGEFFRAYVIGRKEKIPVSSTLATIVIERIVDLFSLLAIMMFAIIIYPFPDWVKKSGYILLCLSLGLFFFLILLKVYTTKTINFLRIVLSVFSEKLSNRIIALAETFIDGVRGLKKKRDYLLIFILSLLVWFCYWFTIHINFYTFHLNHLTVTSSLVVLIITTMSVVIPSSPGYVGTYHLLCQLSLELFGISRAVGLSYAIGLHAISFIPLMIVGLIFAWIEGINLVQLSKNRQLSNFN